MPIIGVDNTGPARALAKLNACMCSHRFKMEDGRFAKCEDCNVQLFREALPRRTGKTARKHREEREI